MTTSLGPSFTRAEFWILGAVLEYRIDMPVLISAELAEALNRRPHGLSAVVIAQALAALFASKLIYAHPEDDDRRTFFPDLAQVKRILRGARGRKTTYYGLTAKGGRQWEAFAAPDWDMYFDDSVTFKRGSPAAFQVIAAREPVAEKYWELLLQAEPGIDAKAVTRKRLRPWHATYWKKLPVGYKISIPWHEDVPPVGGRDLADFKSWTKQRWCGWHY